MPLSEIAEVEATKTLGIIPNGLLVRLVSGAQERFVVQQNRHCVAKILGARISPNELRTDQNLRGKQVVAPNGP